MKHLGFVIFIIAVICGILALVTKNNHDKGIYVGIAFFGYLISQILMACKKKIISRQKMLRYDFFL